MGLTAVEKNLLYPSTPSLTRYEETLVAISRKKAFEPRILDEKSGAALNQFTIPKLCIRLNTLQVSFHLETPSPPSPREKLGKKKDNSKGTVGL